jgi:vacuolar-type H+-ATPase subunit F/Vma7
VIHRVGVLGDSGVSLGFRLAGLRPTVADSPEAARPLLVEMLGDARWGVILVQDDLVPDLETVARQRVETTLPILVPFPAPSREALPGEAETYIAELLRRAVGYRVRLR